MEEKNVKIPVSIDTSKLIDRPGNITDQDLFSNVVIQTIVNYGKSIDGFSYKEHKLLYKVREACNELSVTKEDNLVLSKNSFEFVKKCFENSKFDPSGNEIFIQVADIIFNV